MSMLKILQISTVVMFVGMVVAGVIILATNPALLPAYKELVQTIFPFFLVEVVPALIGKPLTEAARNLSEAKKTKAERGV